MSLLFSIKVKKKPTEYCVCLYNGIKSDSNVYILDKFLNEEDAISFKKRINNEFKEKDIELKNIPDLKIRKENYISFKDNIAKFNSYVKFNDIKDCHVVVERNMSGIYIVEDCWDSSYTYDTKLDFIYADKCFYTEEGVVEYLISRVIESLRIDYEDLKDYLDITVDVGSGFANVKLKSEKVLKELIKIKKEKSESV